MENRKLTGLEEMATLFAKPVKTCMHNKYWEKWFKFLKELNKDPILKVKMDTVNRLRGKK